MKGARRYRQNHFVLFLVLIRPALLVPLVSLIQVRRHESSQEGYLCHSPLLKAEQGGIF